MREKKGPKLPVAKMAPGDLESLKTRQAQRRAALADSLAGVFERPSSEKMIREQVGRPAGTTPATVVVANRFDDLEPHEREEFDELVQQSGLKSERAKRALALDFVMHGRLLAQIEARAKEECSLLDDAKHRNAAVSNRRRILETLKVLGEAKGKTLAEEMAEADAKKTAPSSPASTSPASTSNLDDLLPP